MPARLSLRRALLALPALVALSSFVLAGVFTVFGPETFRPTMGSKKAQIFNRSFSVPATGTTYTLHLVNGGAGLTRVSSCGVAVNGTLVVQPSEINQNVASLDKTISVQSSNTLQLQVAGASGSGITVSITGVDNTPPTISATASPPPNAAGWNNTSVTVSFTCQDTLSGIASCSGPVTVTAEGAGQTVTGTAVDQAGNTATRTVTLNIDKTPPTATTSKAPPPNAAGWNNSDVTVSFVCQDALSGVAGCPGPTTVTTQGSGQVANGVATDRAGNTATASTSLNIDKTSPTITASASPAANANGWNNSSVTVNFTCQDSLSGVASCASPVSLTTEGAAQAASGTVTDLAGNTATASVSVNIDKTPPTITATAAPPVNANGWNNTDVTLTYACQDGLSGIATCPPTGVVSTEGAGQVVTATGTDRAGNSATATTSLSIDKKPPTITSQSSPAPNAAGWNNTDVTVSFVAADALSGVASSTSPVVVMIEGANQAVNGSATDRAGNTASATATVNLDKTRPTLNITAPTGTITGNPAPTIELQYSDAISGLQTATLQVSIDGTPLAGCSTAQSSATCVPPNLTAGQHTVASSIADIAGNSSTVTQGFTLVLATPLDIQITAPQTGLLTNATSLQVSGTVSTRADTVVVDGVTATLQGGTFTAPVVPIVEGSNTITAVATNAAGDAGTSSITVVRDTSPPTLVIETPAANQIVSASTVTIVGLVNDVVTGTVSARNCQVMISGRAGSTAASVNNRSFMVEDFPLVPGPNTITAVATDAAGNVSVPFQLQITRQDLVGQTLRLVSGDHQTAAVGSQLAQPLVVALVSSTGSPVPNRPVTFAISRGDGSLQSGASAVRSLTVQSDQSGQAQALFNLGTRSGLGGQRVAVTATGFVGQVEFVETAVPGPAAGIKVFDSSNLRGVAGRRLPSPFVVFVHDFAGNPVSGAPVTFRVTAGGGDIGGSSMATVMTDDDGRAQIVLTLGPDPGINNNVVQAAFPGLTALPATLIASGFSIGPSNATRVSGVVLDNSNLPVPGATTRILGSGLSAITNDQGQFSISGAPVASITLEVDGTTATRPGVWPVLRFELTTISGQDNVLGMPIYLVPIDTPSGQMAGGPQDVSITMANVQGVSLTVFANSVTCPDGSHQCRISISQVHNDKVPMPPLEGVAPRLIWTVQPAGTRFNPPARITYPNVDGLPPGAVTEVLSFDHDLGQYVSVGTATVSEDGSVITSDPGGGIAHAGWGYPRPDPPPIFCPGSCDDHNECTTENFQCAGLTFLCTHNPVPDGTPCSNSDFDTCTDDYCSNGQCVHVTAPPPECSLCKSDPLEHSTIPDPSMEGKQCSDEGDPSCSIDRCVNGTCTHPVINPPVIPTPDPQPFRLEDLTPDMQSHYNCLVYQVETVYGGVLIPTSAFRTPDYQAHLFEIWDDYQKLKDYSEPECTDLKALILDEIVNKHHLTFPPVNPTNGVSGHELHLAFDVTIDLPAGSPTRDQLGCRCGLMRPRSRRNGTDTVHFDPLVGQCDPGP